MKKGRWEFVLPDETLGASDVVLDVVAKNHGLDRAGTTPQWIEHIAKPHEHNSNVVLSIGTFFAAPLLRWAAEPGGGFHFHGNKEEGKTSKEGKTLAAVLGQSVYGLPYYPAAGENCFGYSWGSTGNRIVQRACCETISVCRWTSLACSSTITTPPCSLPRCLVASKKGRFGQVEQVFNLLILSTGEMSFADFLPDAREGMLVRMADIPARVRVDDGDGSAFETISADMLDVAGQHFYPLTKKLHGTVGHDWLKHLVKLGPKRIEQELDGLRKVWLALPEVADTRKQASPPAISVINRFDSVAAALHMARAAGLIPWSDENIDKGILSCMGRWADGQQRRNTETNTKGDALAREISQRRKTISILHLVHLKIEGREGLVPASAKDKRKLKWGKSTATSRSALRKRASSSSQKRGKAGGKGSMPTR